MINTTIDIIALKRYAKQICASTRFCTDCPFEQGSQDSLGCFLANSVNSDILPTIKSFKQYSKEHKKDNGVGGDER